MLKYVLIALFGGLMFSCGGPSDPDEKAVVASLEILAEDIKPSEKVMAKAHSALRRLTGGDPEKEVPILLDLAEKYAPGATKFILKGQEKSFQRRIQSNAKLILMYAIELYRANDKKFPSLEELKVKVKQRESKSDKDIQALFKNPYTEKAYEYIGEGVANVPPKESPKKVILKSPTGDGRTILGFADGHVEVKKS